MDHKIYFTKQGNLEFGFKEIWKIYVIYKYYLLFVIKFKRNK